MRWLRGLLALVLLCSPALSQSSLSPTLQKPEQPQAASDTKPERKSPDFNKSDHGAASGEKQHKEQCEYEGPTWLAGFYCFFALHDQFWVAFGTLILAVATGALGFATIFLWRSTKSLVSGAEENTQRQLRAYVSGTVFHVSSFDADELAIFRFKIENVGLTPARMVVHHSEVFVAPEPLPDDFVFPAIAAPLSNPANIFPKQSFEGSTTAVSFFTLEERRKIIDGSARIYCYGEIFYEDVFGKKDCRTNFCTAIVADVETMKKLSSGYRKPDLNVKFQIARVGNSDT